MQFAFWLADASSVAWGNHGVFMTAGKPMPVDDPFVQAHLGEFSLVPPGVYATDGRTFEQTPMSADQPVQQVRGRRNG